MTQHLTIVNQIQLCDGYSLIIRPLLVVVLVLGWDQCMHGQCMDSPYPERMNRFDSSD